MRGMFVTIEGLDGTGKSTSLNILRRLLASRHGTPRTVYTSEPAYTHAKGAKYSQMIRHLLLAQDLSKPLQASLFIVARKLHIEHVIKPALRHGDLVISSRGILSNLAYQGDFRRDGTDLSDRNRVLAMNGQNIPHLIDYLPDVNFYFTMDPQGEEERLLGRPAKHDKFDAYLSNTKHIRTLQRNYQHGIAELAGLGSPTVTINASKYDQYQRAEIMYDWITKHLSTHRSDTDKTSNTYKAKDNGRRHSAK